MWSNGGQELIRVSLSHNQEHKECMTVWTVHQIIEATGGQLVRGTLAGAVNGISIDSRRLTPGEAFVAIEGTRFDGHRFVEEAAHRGASCLIVSRLHTPTNGSSVVPTVLVDDTTEALGNLARYHRRRLGTLVIAVTGSCGKTTTKELIAHLLGEPEAIFEPRWPNRASRRAPVAAS